MEERVVRIKESVSILGAYAAFGEERIKERLEFHCGIVHYIYMRNTEKGSIFEPLLILLGLAIITVFYILPSEGVLGPSKNFGRITSPGTYDDYAASHTTSGPKLTATSAYARSIYLGTGNASYTVEPSDEYVTIENQADAPINITGWKLKNNTENRTYYAGNTPTHYTSTEVTIPQAAGYVSTTGYSLLQNVVLKPGETAIVTTGSMGVQSPYKITSFKENECSGYLEALPQYDFTPALTNMCIQNSQEPGYDALDAACKQFISGMPSCRTPVYGKTDRYSSDNCDNCVNGRPAPSSVCLSYIKDHFSYPGCINYHANDAKFYGTTWRIFLGQKWELWGKDDEVISLFDQFGNLAAYKAY